MTGWLLAARAAEAVVVGGALALLATRFRGSSVPASADPAAPKRGEPREADDLPRVRRTPDGVPVVESRDAPEPGAVIAAFLRDAADALGADEAVLWRYTADRQDLAPAATSTGGAPLPVYAAAAIPLAMWSAQERMTHFGGGTAGPTLALAPVAAKGAVIGTIGFYRAAGVSESRDLYRRWLPRCATHLGQLVELLETREEFVRQSQQQKELLGAARDFQQNRSIEDLGRSICETAVRVTGARRAALVRWFPDGEHGEVQSVSPTDAELVGLELTAGSHVSQMCVSGLPQVWDDASHFDRGTPVFGLGEPRRAFGSLAIVPLKRDRKVSGAIVIEGERKGDVRIKDVRNVHLLAAMAAVSLETLWEIEEVTRRARTDQLTGLPNRRAFDDALATALVLAERYGQPLSLILADIDNFKRVNDTHGHAAGDQVLRTVASTLQRLVRTSDLCARFGGEEIAILLPQTPQGGAEELAERLRAAVESRTVRTGGREIPVTVSFGVACYRESVVAADGLFAAADRALYRAKADGRNCVRASAIIAD